MKKKTVIAILMIAALTACGKEEPSGPIPAQTEDGGQTDNTDSNKGKKEKKVKSSGRKMMNLFTGNVRMNAACKNLMNRNSPEISACVWGFLRILIIL